MTVHAARHLRPGDVVVLDVGNIKARVREVHDGGYRVSVTTETGRRLTIRFDAIERVLDSPRHPAGSALMAGQQAVLPVLRCEHVLGDRRCRRAVSPQAVTPGSRVLCWQHNRRGRLRVVR